jgi:hypothetical protein
MLQHKVIIKMLQHKGFSQKWIDWVRNILSSGISSVLLNVVLGKVFHYRRGLDRVTLFHLFYLC